jgi:hypothetical protein
MVQAVSAAAATAFNRIELNPADVILLSEVGISHDGAANDTNNPVRYQVQRLSTVGTGSAGTVVKMSKDKSSSLGTTALINNTADGSLSDAVHTWFVPIVAGIVWVAAPNQEVDCQAAEFLAVKNMAALPASRSAAVYVVFKE